jgi:hypothetical protein
MTDAHLLSYAGRIQLGSERSVLMEFAWCSCEGFQVVDGPAVFVDRYVFQLSHYASLGRYCISQASLHTQTTECSVQLLSFTSGLDSRHLRYGLTICIAAIKQTCAFLHFIFCLYRF